MTKGKSLEEWKGIIQTARESGLTDKDWCLANDVNINTFYYNVKRLRAISCEPKRIKAMENTVHQQVVPVEIVENPSDEVYSGDASDKPTAKPFEESIGSVQAPVIQIRSQGIQVSITNEASTRLVKALVSAMGGHVC